MELTGSAVLQLRLEQQRHWQQARAVRDGSQSAVDPDSARLLELGSGERVYEGIGGTFVKRLIGGAWQIESDFPDLYY